jgi:hypothetical protein
MALSRPNSPHFYWFIAGGFMYPARRVMGRLAASAAMLVALGVGSPASAQEEKPTLKIDLKAQVYAESTDWGAGQDRQGSRTDIHFQRLRLTLTGMLDDVWGMKFQTCGNCGTTKTPFGYGVSGQDVDGNDRDIRIIDAYGIANFAESFNLKIGLTKIPLTRANLDDCFAPLSLDRSMFAYSAYGSSPAKFSRDFGVVAWGELANEKVAYYAGVLQGREGLTKTTHPFSGATVTSSIEPSSSLEYVGRVHFALLDGEPGAGYQGTYLGERKIFTVGFGAAYEPDVVYRNVAGTGAVLNNETASYSALAADVLFEYPTKAGMPTITAQYLKSDFDDAYKTNLNPGDRLANIGGVTGQKKGWYAKGAYLLPGKIMGRTALQPYFVYEDWDFAFLLGNMDQHLTQSGGGLNVYGNGQKLRLTLEYLKTDFDKLTGLVGSRVDPVTFAPVDKFNDFGTFRVMFQIVLPQ